MSNSVSVKKSQDLSVSSVVDVISDERPGNIQFGSSEFRAYYRTHGIPAYYSGRAHLLLTCSIPLLGIYFSIMALDRVTWTELLSVPLIFLYANFVEYLSHRGPMHRKIKGLSAIYKHVTIHHNFFTDKLRYYENPRDFHALLLPPYIVVFIFLFAVPVAILVFYVISPNVAYLFAATVIAYFLSYELLHSAYHAPVDSFVRRLPFVKALAHHHTVHHNPRLMTRCNFNITYPICDWLFGTSYKT